MRRLRDFVSKLGLALFSLGLIVRARRATPQRAVSVPSLTRPRHGTDLYVPAPLRVCIIGGGISGLMTAWKLLKLPLDTRVEVTVLERDDVLGGRAGYRGAVGEHCTRTFLRSYTELFSVLDSIPHAAGTLLDNVVRVTRLAYNGTGWVEVDHAYSMFDSTISTREQVAVFAERAVGRIEERAHLTGRPLTKGQRVARTVLTSVARPTSHTPSHTSPARLSIGDSPLVGQQALRNTNTVGSSRNYSNRTLRDMLRNMAASTDLFSLTGRTDDLLVRPIAEHLNAAGVKISTGTTVSRLEADEDGTVRVVTDGSTEVYDAVVVALAAPDAVELLGNSGLRHAIPNHQQTHCKTATISVHPDEACLDRVGPEVRHADGISMLLQPDASRIVIMAGAPLSTEDDFLVERVRGVFGLQHPVTWLSSENSEPRAGVWAADPVPRSAVSPMESSGIFVAGAYMECDYPLDSAEAAARSAHDAVLRMLRTRKLSVRPTAHGEYARH